jgi:hypothetical protein
MFVVKSRFAVILVFRTSSFYQIVAQIVGPLKVCSLSCHDLFRVMAFPYLSKLEILRTTKLPL